MGLIAKVFGWWENVTPGAWLTIRTRGGKLMGEDEFGNRYYQEARPSAAEGYKRRWVIYQGYAEASKTPPEWFAWLHHMRAEPPSGEDARYDWELEHRPNLTGTELAWRPPGSLARGGERPTFAGDYEAWSPDPKPAD